MSGEVLSYNDGRAGWAEAAGGAVSRPPEEVVRQLGVVSAGPDARPVDHLTESLTINETTTCRQAAELPSAAIPGEGKVISIETEMPGSMPQAA